MAAKKGVCAHLEPPLPESGGQTPGPHRIAVTGKKRGAEVTEIEKPKA